MGTRDDFADDQSFRHAVDELLTTLLDQVDKIDSDDLDPQRSSGTLLVTFEETGDVFMLSQQTPTHELWLSANLTAWHFLRVRGCWVERDSSEPMTEVLSRLFSGKVGAPVAFSLS